MRLSEHLSRVRTSDARILTVVALAAVVWLLEVADGVTAILMMQRSGESAELNPLVRGLFQTVGVPGIVALKCGLIGMVIGTFIVLAYRRRVVLARNCLLIAMLFAVLGILSNLS